MIKKLRLTDFRNFEDKLIEFSAKSTVIVGENASGKTNILEALHMLSTGKSFKARVEEDMVRHQAGIARVKGKFVNGDEELVLEVMLTRGTMERSEGQHERVPKKRLLVATSPKRLMDFAGRFRMVLFRPEDMDLVTDSPSIRRGFLNGVLSLTDSEYRRSLLAYEKGLRRRNRLLIRIREEGIPRSQLLFWNQLLIKNGDYLSQAREAFIEFVNERKAVSEQEYRLVYDKSGISEARLDQYAHEEVFAGMTLVGPHRDDIIFELTDSKAGQWRPLDAFGSRGEQRMGVLWLKLAELAFVKERVEEEPTLLLDDIFSELDHEHREVVMGAIAGQQTIITTADPHYIEDIKPDLVLELAAV